MLVAPGRDQEITLECDASGRSYGYVIFCKQGVLTYGGGTFLKSVESSHNIFEKELASLALSIQNAFPLLTQAKKIIFKNDNISAVFSTNHIKTKLTSRALKYLSAIQQYTSDLDCKIIHLTTKENLMADILSRLDYDSDGNIALEANSISFDKLDIAEYIKHIHEHTHWSMEKMCKSFKMLNIEYDPNLVKRVWNECTKCGRLRKLAPLSKLKPHNTADRPADLIHIDFIEKKSSRLNSSDGHVGIFTIRDDHSRYLMAFAEKSLTISPVIDRIRSAMGIVGKRFRAIYADNAFKCKAMKQFCTDEDIDLHFRPSHMSRSIVWLSTCLWACF